MNKSYKFLILPVIFLFVCVFTFADELPYRLTEREVENLLDRLERSTDEFEESLDDAIDESSIDGSNREDNINDFVDAFEDAADRLESRFDQDRSAPADVEEVLNRAAAIDRFVFEHNLPQETMEHWNRVRVDLDELAAAYSVSWGWSGTSGQPVRISHDEIEDLLERLESKADRFRDEVDDAMDDSEIDGSRLEDNLNAYIKDFEQATDLLEERYDEDEQAAGFVEEVLRRSARIDDFVSRYITDREAQESWMAIREDLDLLARGYNVSWRWGLARR